MMSQRLIRPSFEPRKPKLTQGKLRTPVVFYSAMLASGVDGRDEVYEEVYRTYAHVYNPSMKDLEIGRGRETKVSLTIQIRDPLDDYQPLSEHFVEVRDRRFKGKWPIVDIRPDFEHQEYIAIVLGGLQHD